MESTSVDPFDILHSDVFNLIFQHFSRHELLELSTVNSLWYQTIALSPQCMSKLKINILRSLHSNNNNDLETAGLQKELNSLISIRQYRNIYADFTQQSKQKILDILSPCERKWKSVELLNENFKGERFFEYFQETAESLILTRINCEEESSTNSSFPRLKCLKISSCNESLLKILEDCSSLKTLHFQTACDTSSLHDRLANLLSNNKNLEEMTLFFHRSLLTRQIIAKCQFNLKTLVIDSSCGFTTEDRECLAAFLKCQSGSLEVVDINPWSGPLVIEQCLKMEILKDFTYNVDNWEQNLDWNTFNLTRNLSIERFHLRSASPHEPPSFYDAMFSNAPNLKVYKAKCMQFQDLVLLSSRCKNLEELYIEEFDVAMLPNESCFPRLKKFRSWNVNEELMKSLNAKGAKNMFEEFILNF